MQEDREWLVQHVTLNDSQKSDLLNPGITHDNLIQLLINCVNQGHHLLITSVKSDHGDDSGLGPHSHFAGWAVDVWPSDNLLGFLQDCATRNKLVTKIGLGGSQAQALVDSFGHGDTIVFNDNDEPHIHLQTE